MARGTGQKAVETARMTSKMATVVDFMVGLGGEQSADEQSKECNDNNEQNKLWGRRVDASAWRQRKSPTRMIVWKIKLQVGALFDAILC